VPEENSLEFNPLAFIEMFVVFAFAIGWGILELVGMRLDKKRKEEREREAGKSSGTGT
jgi:hypothetical protein